LPKGFNRRVWHMKKIFTWTCTWFTLPMQEKWLYDYSIDDYPRDHFHGHVHVAFFIWIKRLYK
jgi:hypothetical protein